MIDTKLILVDGMPGTGKSTTAQFIFHLLRESNMSATWYWEMDQCHPVPPLSVKDMPDGLTLVEKALDRWRVFMDSTSNHSDRVFILDSSILQNTVRVLFDHGYSFEEIETYSNQVESIIDKKKPYLIYFRPDNISDHIKTTIQKRGQEFADRILQYIVKTPYGSANRLKGEAGYHHYWSDYQAVCDSLFEEFNMHKIKIENSKENWNHCRQKIANELDLQLPVAYNQPYTTVSRILGHYEDRESDLCCEIREMGDQLIIDNLLSPMEKSSVLFHETGNEFCLRGAQVKLLFDPSELETDKIRIKSTWKRIDGKTLHKTSATR